jgi:pantetheine-phosphate adenylyltransferase
MNSRDLSVLYPGSFDPVHLGHVDVIEQATELFGRVIVAVMHNPSKPSGLFTIPERVAMLEAGLVHLDGVRVEPFGGLAIDAARSSGASFIVKGLRNAGDFEIEQQMAHTNHSVSGVRTVYVACRPDRVFLSSRFIREIAQYGGDVSHLVPATVASELARLSEATS